MFLAGPIIEGYLGAWSLGGAPISQTIIMVAVAYIWQAVGLTMCSCTCIHTYAVAFGSEFQLLRKFEYAAHVCMQAYTLPAVAFILHAVGIIMFVKERCSCKITKGRKGQAERQTARQRGREKACEREAERQREKQREVGRGTRFLNAFMCTHEDKS